MHSCTNVHTIRDEKKWEAEIKADIPADVFDRYYQKALKDVQKNAKLDGFRPGHAPLDRIVAIYGEAAIVRQAAEDAIDEELPLLLASEALPIVDAPKVTIEKMSKEEGLSFSARAPLAPEITLPDYKKIAQKHNAQKEEVVVSDEEHAKALEHIRRERAR